MTIDVRDIDGAGLARDPVQPASLSGDAADLSRDAAGFGREPGAPPAGIDSEARRRIGRNLRTLYAGVLDLPLPDRFESLLAELSGQPASRET